MEDLSLLRYLPSFIMMIITLIGLAVAYGKFKKSHDVVIEETTKNTKRIDEHEKLFNKNELEHLTITKDIEKIGSDIPKLSDIKKLMEETMKSSLTEKELEWQKKGYFHRHD